MTDAIDLAKEQRNTLRALLRRFIPSVSVWAYGSRVKWTARPNSDLDLVAFTTPPQRPQVAELKEALAESNLPFPVDLHVWDEVPERFREIIRKEYVVLQEAKQPGSGSNMAGWKDITLGDFVALQRGHDLTEPERRPGHVPVMGSAGQNGFHDTALAKGPGIVIGRSGASFGQVHFCTTDYWPHNTGLYVTDFKGNDPRFAYYFLKALDFDRYNSGSAQPSLNRNFIYPIPICVPEPAEQKSIAHVIGTLDDKIELNRRMNETLEAMARALFKSWFVDFDPVRAKAEGRDHGLPKPLADLFPDSFEDSELGEIPKGWEVKKLSELCSTQYGYTASAVLEPVGPKFIRVTDINKRNWIEWANVPHCQIDDEARVDYALQVGDIVVARMADPGKSAIIEEDIDAVFASYLVRLKTESLAHSYYVYGFLKSDLYLEYAEGAKSGSVQANMNARVIVGADIVVPSQLVIERFFGAVLPLRKRLIASVREAHTLAALRDTLLPKLISGKLRVKDTKSFLEQQS